MAVATYRGDVEGDQLGVTLMHEHVFVMAAELAVNYPGYADWDEDRAVGAAADRLDELKRSGVDTIVDLTVLGLGRLPSAVARVAARTEINIVAATGVYVLNELPLYFKLRGPGSMFDEPEPMVDLFVSDLQRGMAGTGTRAAVLKCATDRAGMTKDVERALRAVARAHVATGAPISTHTNAAKHTGLDQQRVFASEGVDLGRVVIGHSGDTEDLAYLEALLEAGSYLGMDRFGLSYFLEFDRRIAVVAELCRRGWAHRLVLSHDAACHNDGFRAADFHRAAPDHDFGLVLRGVVPALEAAGVSQTEVHQMLVDNPRRILDFVPPDPERTDS